MLEVLFPLAWRKHLKNVFQLLKVLPSIFFLLNHVYSSSGIHSLWTYNECTCVSPGVCVNWSVHRGKDHAHWVLRFCSKPSISISNCFFMYSSSCSCHSALLTFRCPGACFWQAYSCWWSWSFAWFLMFSYRAEKTECLYHCYNNHLPLIICWLFHTHWRGGKVHVNIYPQAKCPSRKAWQQSLQLIWGHCQPTSSAAFIFRFGAFT